MHEIGHTLGLWHEHQRPDRDDHINILQSHIANKYKMNFKAAAEEYLDYPVVYDYNSVMHYGPKV